jgi:hypothetical protein
MYHFLLDSCVRGHGVNAWSYSREESTLVTGATSLAGLALVEASADRDLLTGISAFLLSAQHPDGGWSEVVGYEPTIHNTFNTVRYLRAARDADILCADTSRALARAGGWFSRRIGRRPIRTSLELAYALRLAVQMEMCRDRRVEQLAMRLSRRRDINLAPTADLYAETEITAIALLESSRHIDSSAETSTVYWAWRWTLPALPPPFLSHTSHLYELLYGLMRSRRWIKVVDWLVNSAAVDKAAGLLLGAVAALGFVDDYVTTSMTNLGSGARGTTTVALVVVASALWLSIKSCAYSSLLRAVRASAGSAIATSVLTWILYSPTPLYPSGIALLALRWLVIDIIAHTADASGLLNRMISR